LACCIFQESLEDISKLLRIPQRKPYGTMEGDVKKAMKVNCLLAFCFTVPSSSEFRIQIH
jgi:hypothetical protein